MSDPTPNPTLVQAADGTTLATRVVQGDGNLVVVLHGFSGDGSAMLPLADASTNGRPALILDLIGHGASDAPSFVEPYAMSSVVDQVLSLIGPHEPGSVHLIGYSMGGRIALSMAARAPWYFASVTTISASAGIDDPIDRAERHDADHVRADHIERIGVPLFIDEWLELPLFASYVASLDDQSLSATIEQRCRNSATGLANSLRGTGAGAMPPLWQQLSSLRSPLLAIAGERDERYVALAERMAQLAPFGQVSVVANAGHVTHAENLNEVSTIVRSFLKVCDQHADH
ncbi:MAG: 2-succinyl-6-hydroxy-2,4-cyclohexadiene-1-carboxylate synthase [Verrucomicrobiales bacterium]|jgi:2-succinyl-6-hydroxy-2,4-cyclohexadiene-1-carboxylate synthase